MSILINPSKKPYILHKLQFKRKNYNKIKDNIIYMQRYINLNQDILNKIKI
jgi:hypothetical protein